MSCGDVVNRQGIYTKTILTNRSNHITIVTEEKCINNKESGQIRSYNKEVKQDHHPIRKGERKMHVNTHNFGQNAFTPSYISSTKESFSGSRKLPCGKRPPQLPSQHKSHFQLGHLHNEFEGSEKYYVCPQISSPTIMNTKTIRESGERLRQEMSGQDVCFLLAPKSHESDCSTTYKCTYGSTMATKKLKENHLSQVEYYDKVNVITGELFTLPRARNHHRISGNTILKDARYCLNNEPFFG